MQSLLSSNLLSHDVEVVVDVVVDIGWLITLLGMTSK